jgi:DNA repair protein RecO (recombination protein O)
VSEPEVGTEAVVLAARPAREADLAVVLLTPDLGKISAFAPAARRSRNRFAGGLPVGALGTVRLRRHRGGRHTLAGFVPSNPHLSLGRDLVRLGYVAYLCELTDVLVVAPEPDAARFAALARAIVTLVGDAPDPAVLRAYELALLASLGQLPALSACAVCGADLEPAPVLPLSWARGGVVCPLHAEATAAPVPALVLALAERLLAGDDPIAVLRDQPAAVRKSLRDLTRGAIGPSLRAPLRSLRFLAEVGRSGRTVPAGDVGGGEPW